MKRLPAYLSSSTFATVVATISLFSPVAAQAQDGVGNGGTPILSVASIPIDDDLTIIIPVQRNIPSDPGVAGTMTPTGIDADNDGVRDDLERQIVMLYPNNAPARGYMYDMAKAYQSILLNRTSVATVVANYSRLAQLQFCLERVVSADARGTDLLPQLLNTYERSLAYVEMLTLIETANIPTQFICP